MTEKANSPEGIKLLKSDMEKVKNVVIKIREGFKTTGADLKVIDDQKHDGGKTVWGPKWDKYRTDFEATLAKSKDIASKVAGYAQSFDGKVCKVVKSTAEKKSKLTILKNHIELGQGFEKESQELSTEFGAIIKTLQGFKVDFGKWVQDLVGDVEEKIKKVDTDIANIKSNIKGLKLKIGGLTAIGGAMTAASSLGLFPAFTPFVIVGALIALVTGALLANKWKNDLSSAEEELVAKEAEKVRLTKELDGLKLLQKKYENEISDKIDGIIEGVGLFEVIWKAVADDCSQIVQWLEQGADDIEKSRESAPPTFYAYLENSSTYYKALADGLDMYNRGIAS